ncbi:glycerophosphodiester phosphodiesterase [bacterium]|nr:glycerophosphodiester phosphodiesterase [bacterium]MCI0602135.1 glycerophosphodiester phosphodiesterase [bacterium]
MNLKKATLLIVSGFGLFSVANFSAEVASYRPKKKLFQDGRFWRIAHRGFSGRYPENTMAAFEAAAKLSIDALELDVHSTRDGRIVVIHDATLDRTTDRTGRVFNQNWSALKLADAGFMFDPDQNGSFPFRGKGITIPLLEDVFKTFPHLRVVIEIKQTLPAIEEPVYRLIKKYKMEDKVIVASEHTEPLLRFRSLAPSIATNLSGKEALGFYHSFRVRLGNFYKSPGDALQIPPRFRGDQVVTRAFCQAAKKKGIVIHVWTVNDPEEMKQLIDFGVDGIITDFPDRLLEVTPAGS